MFKLLSIGISYLDWDLINQRFGDFEFKISVEHFESLDRFNNQALIQIDYGMILYDRSLGLPGIKELAKIYPQIPIVFFSEDFRESIEAMRLGAEEFIIPSDLFSYEEFLIILINKWVRHWKQVENSEQQRKQKLLQQFSRMFSSVTNSMVRSLSMEEIDRNDIINVLRLLGELMSLEYCSVGFFVDDYLPADRFFVWEPGETNRPSIFKVEESRVAFPKDSWSVQELRQGRWVVANTIDDLPEEAVLEREQLEMLGAKSSVTVPLRVNEQLIGYMRLTNFSTVHVWQELELKIIEACAGIFVAVHLRWDNLDQLRSSMMALEQKNQEVSAINQMSVRLQRSKNMAQIYAANEEYAQILFPNSVGMIHLFSKNGQPASMTQWGEWPFSLLVSVEQIFFNATEAAKKKRADINAICSRFEQQIREAMPDVNAICLPLYVQSETIGLFSLFFMEQHPLSEEIQALSKSYAERLALAISNLQLRDNLHYHSVRDPLTGLYNRRFMEHVFENEMRRAVRRNYSLSAIMMDIDHFKKVNDSLGHEIGDIVLSAVARFLKKHLRKEDVVCRFGGDEFVILLPQTKVGEAYRRADFLRKSCSEIYTDALISEFNVDYITLSFGIAGYPEHGTEPPELLRAADHALYYSKNHGRNQVRIAPKDITGSLYSKTKQKLDAKRWGVGRNEEELSVMKKMPILVGSNNRGKLKEIETILKEATFFDQLEFYLPADLEITLDVDETGSTYAENAALKARAFYEAARDKFDQFIVLADDSGLEVDVLGGQPGIRSARYAPYPNATDADRRRYLLQEIHNKPQPWEARFHCTIAMVDPEGELHLFEGICPGQIIARELGQNGFGYDPIFLLPNYGLTMAQIDEQEKNQISHRGAALRKALPAIRTIVE